MKITLWQQFSSNHSALYTVVGTFRNIELAKKAAREIRSLLRSIGNWWDSLSLEEREAWEKHIESAVLTPPEAKFRDQYKIEWPFSLYWFGWAWDEEPVHRIDTSVFISNPHLYTSKGPQPFDELLAKLGGEVFVQADASLTYPNTVLFIDIVCDLPTNEEDTEILFESLRQDFEAHHIDHLYANEHYSHNLDIWLDYSVVNDRFIENNVRVYEVERDDNELKLYGIRPTDGYWWEDLPRFIDFLRNEGCSDIRFTFRSAQKISVQDSHG